MPSCQPGFAVRARISLSPSPEIILILRPPESLSAASSPLSFASDTWFLACTVFAIPIQRPLFGSWFPTPRSLERKHVSALGPPPQEIPQLWEQQSSPSDDNHTRDEAEPPRPLDERFEESIRQPRLKENKGDIDEGEKGTFLALLKSMLAYPPEGCCSVAAALDSEWMVRWAKPEVVKVRATSGDKCP